HTVVADVEVEGAVRLGGVLQGIQVLVEEPRAVAVSTEPEIESSALVGEAAVGQEPGVAILEAGAVRDHLRHRLGVDVVRTVVSVERLSPLVVGVVHRAPERRLDVRAREAVQALVLSNHRSSYVLSDRLPPAGHQRFRGGIRCRRRAPAGRAIGWGRVAWGDGRGFRIDPKMASTLASSHGPQSVPYGGCLADRMAST